LKNKTKTDIVIQYRFSMSMDDRSLYSGLVRLHILHHSAQRPVYGAWVAEELARHGYKLSAGTLYPVLHALERKGYLRSSKQRAGRWTRRVYRTTPVGRRALMTAGKRVRELFGEMFGMRPNNARRRRVARGM
jgi:PadR family transcriptional regulator, regulatory protein PadR